MTTTEEIVTAIAQLSDSDKRRLVHEIWQMMHPGYQSTSEEMAELERRLAMDDDSTPGFSWEEVKRNLLSKR